MTPPTAEIAALARPHAWSELLRNRNVRWGLVLIGLLALMALLAPVLPLHKPDELFPEGLDDNGMPVPPSRQFWLGTDGLGRDVFSRLWYGARISLSVGTVAMLTATLIGAFVGLVAGYGWRWMDAVLMRFTDIMLALPAILLAIALAGIIAANKEPPPTPQTASNSESAEFSLESWFEQIKPWFRPRQGLLTLSMVIAIVSWTGMARVVRAQVLTLKERDFVHAARALGCSPTRILFRHILPNVLPTIIVLATLSTAGTIGLEAGLSFLGIGIPPPTPSWGSMVNDGQAFMLAAPWLVLPPALAIILAVFGFNLLGQGLQDVLDPYQKKGV